MWLTACVSIDLELLAAAASAMIAAHPDDTGGGVMGAGTGAQRRWR